LDADRFDSLARSVSAEASRRRIARALAGATLAALAVPLGFEEAAADCSGQGGSCKKKNKCCNGLKCNNKDKCKYKNSCGGKQGDYCQNNGDCCNDLKCKSNTCK
jgi:hypothetical protein